jgi:hypothetical protein
MKTRGLRFAGTRHRLPGFPAAAGLLLALAANAASAGPPGIAASNLELTASAVADGAPDMVQAVSAAVSGAADTGVERGSAPARGDVHASNGGKERKKSLEDLVVEFLEKL